MIGFAQFGVGLIIAASFVLTPLPTVDFGLTTGWCGPGATSENAVQILMHPQSVIEAVDGSLPIEASSSEQALMQACQSKAQERFTYAGITGLTMALMIVLTSVALHMADPQRRPYRWEVR